MCWLIVGGLCTYAAGSQSATFIAMRQFCNLNSPNTFTKPVAVCTLCAVGEGEWAFVMLGTYVFSSYVRICARILCTHICVLHARNVKTRDAWRLFNEWRPGTNGQKVTLVAELSLCAVLSCATLTFCACDILQCSQ